ncbi:MAG: ATP-dependent RNA helicase HrpA [Desulfobulbaceae bacterium DB1]|nr:MAG: ATP-dependent RNA helicase HrpA [Desulfobulbaceae bacterium DB1]
MTDTISYPADLPIAAEKNRIVEAIRENQVVVIAGDTGSGKSTQIPKMCLEAGRGKAKLIGCTQPRRLAATSVAERVREELGTAAFLVGYKIRFLDRTGPDTRIKFMTDGILLAESQGDPLLRAYDTIIIDEAHERSLNIDFLLGILKKLLHRRTDLKLIITSATIDTEKFSRAFGNAPVIEVSGRAYPVQIRYLEEQALEGDEAAPLDIGFVEQAVDVVLDLCRRDGGGDMLVFMPTERDIRDTVELLGKRFRNEAARFGIKEREPEILPLFGRLSGADQNRIFRKSQTRKIVVSTNVAETSVTVPGIRFVVDTGLARISSYNVRARTTKLPVTAVSRASCDQRAGRCGRVGPGICVRLYSEAHYLARPQFTPPEIVRSNLAEVILRMIALHLGSPKNFPFIDPPMPRAINDGYNLLIELGALDRERQLTDMGRIMARLPLDPRISRMIMAARENNCLREVVIIAAALSIQDPRIRPAGNAGQADEAHGRFRSKQSDFLSFLHLWDQYESMVGNEKSRSALRRFCKKNFLSYQRLREWRDIHEQIWSQLATAGSKKMGHLFLKSSCLAKDESGPQRDYGKGYNAIHQAVLAGNLRNIGLKKEKNIYQGGQGKELMIFPGSGLFNKAGQWIMAAELVETSRLYARTVAAIEPQWLEPLAGGLCRYSYSAPHWERKQGKVAALAAVSLFGLVIEAGRKVNYGPINPQEARQIFIQAALVEGDLGGHFLFLEKNRQLIARLADLEERMRRRDILVDDFLLSDFYDKRLPEDIFDRAALARLVKQKGDDFLLMREEDILRQPPESDELADYPRNMHCGELTFPLSYSFAPGQENDGVTVKIPADLATHVQPEKFEWLVPGLLREKIVLLLKGLPKSIRRNLIPIPQTAAELFDRLCLYEGSLYDQLEELLYRRFRLRIERSLWARDALPPHLKIRYELLDGVGKTVEQGREYASLAKTTPQVDGAPEFAALRAVWEKDGVTDWDFAELPQRIAVKDKSGRLAGFAYPGLVEEDGRVALRLFPGERVRSEKNAGGLRALYMLHFGKQCKALQKDVALPRSHWALYEGIASHEEFNCDLIQFVMTEIFGCRQDVVPSRHEFAQTVARLQEQGLYPAARRLVDQVIELLRERRALLDYIAEMEQACRTKPKPGITVEDCLFFRQEVAHLLPGRFLLTISEADLARIPRYLKAIRIRMERKTHNPAKDGEKAVQLAVHRERLARLLGLTELTTEQRKLVGDFALMVEEFTVSLFAQELKTAFPVSAKRLDSQWREIRKAIDNL